VPTEEEKEASESDGKKRQRWIDCGGGNHALSVSNSLTGDAAVIEKEAVKKNGELNIEEKPNSADLASPRERRGKPMMYSQMSPGGNHLRNNKDSGPRPLAKHRI